MRLASPAFPDGGVIPRRFTCDGENVSPPLQWRGAPPDTRSFVLLCDDPDAPAGVWRHWAVYDISSATSELEEGVGVAVVACGYKQGINDFHRLGYGGPCPPRRHGVHHYHFRLLALSCVELGLREASTCKEVEQAARKQACAEATLIGRYERR
jgi:Raf kinase inhibitor-like YbhB/YbcL family protein